MATNKMLIDASHPEETRVAVVRGNRIEEFDFESLEKQQLRGNIYLAKVTRVEPSLQAAFVDYGGNRHGFLAFSEIHPDYYQIPVADRQALLEEEAADARASREAEDLEDEKPKSKRPRRSRSSKKADAENEQSKDSDSNEDSSEEASQNVAGEEVGEAQETVEEPKKKTRRPRKRTKKVVEETDAAGNDDDGNDGDRAGSAAAEPEDSSTDESKLQDTPKEQETGVAGQEDVAQPTSEGEQGEDVGASEESSEDSPPKSMAAMVEMDTISEAASESDSEDENAGEETDSEGAEDEEKPAPKKRRRATRTKAKAKEVDPDEQTDSVEEGEGQTSALIPDGEQTADATASSDDTIDGEPSGEDAEQVEAKAEKPKRKRSTRRKRKSTDEDEADKEAKSNTEDAGGSDEEDDDVESVGQEDALEEVPERFKSRRQYKIQEVIKRRQVLLVQVVKEERGNKGAALTTYLSLAGRYSVLMPNTARGGGISRKITNANDRKRLKAIANELEVPEGMGVILRTAGASRTKAEINRDFEYLLRLWEKVRNLTLSSSAPCLVYEEGSLIKRSIRDLYNKDIGEILVSGEAGYQEASDFMGMLMPKHVKNVKQYNDSATIFTRFGVEAQLERMVAPQVTLKSGGYLVMNQTEALVAIDVNSGRSTREHSIEDTALQTNLEAAEEVARQLRLRDLAGLIVIDFIDMEEKRNNRAVEKRLKDCLKNDRARIQVGRISHFGLLEMSRQRIRASVLESTMDACPHCQGMGYVRSDSAIALHVFRAIEEHLGKHNKFNIVVKTSASIALYILNHKRMALLDLEARFGLKIFIEGDLNVVGQEFKIERGEPARGRPSNKNTMAYNGGSDNVEAVEAVDHESGDEEGGDRKRRRKRRRGKRRENESEDVTEAGSENLDENSAEAGDKTVDETEHAVEAGSEDGEGRPKSRRGKRGGRRKKAATVADVESENMQDQPEASGEPANTESGDIEAAVSDGEHQPAEEEPRRPRRSTRRPKKEGVKPVEVAAASSAAETSEDVAVADTGPETQTEQPRTPEPPRKARRSTRRPKKGEGDSDAVGSPETDDTNQGADSVDTGTPESVPGNEAIVSADDASEAKSPKKRGGWWSRGGGFFG